MPRKRTPSLILELPLRTSPADERACDEKKPLRQRYHQFPDGTRVGRDLYSAFLARYVHDGCLDAIQAANAWAGTQAFLRAASDGFEPARGRGFALPHVTLGVRAGRSSNGAKSTREAGML
jgi:hypothetical protein